MNAVRGIWRDLIDKRLWPYALALLVVIAAVPVVLARTAGGGEPAEEEIVVAGAAAAGPREAVITAADPGESPSAGDMRNPFYEPPQPEEGAGATGGSGSPAGGSTGEAVEAAGSAGAPQGSGEPAGDGTTTPVSDTPSSGGSTGGSKGSGGTTKKTTKGSGESGYDVSLRFGTETEMKTFKAVPRLTPLPAADNPSFVYLGVLSGGKTAVFMIAVDVTAVGDGTCRPSLTECETLELKAGETMFLDVPGEDGKVIQYQLDVTAIKKIGKGGNTLSNEEAGRTSAGSETRSAVEAGKKAVRRARKTSARRTLDRYRFVRARGVVVRRPGTKAKAARASGLRVRRTGHVVAGGL